MFELVPNISEGRDAAVVRACADAMEHAGVRVVHRTSDPAHHRSVLTAIGSGEAAVDAGVAIARVARERIDLRRHQGVHPRIGALDVLPFVPLGEATLDDAVALARRAAERIWSELRIPSHLYGAAATAPERRGLAALRRGAQRLDFGDAAHATAGAIAIGARPLLIAFNVELATGDLAQAVAIARALRGSSGGLRSLQALGLRLDTDRVQVSCNLTDIDAVPLYRVTELVRRAASRAGVAVLRSELIGLAPERALARTARAYRASTA